MKRYEAKKISLIAIFGFLLLVLFSQNPGWSGDGGGYAGSEACMECHETEYHNFKTYAKKYKSFESIAKLKKGLTQEEIEGCYQCHTTGYGKPGGFISPERTPHLKEAGCEVCHGPGAAHAESGDPEDIKGRLDVKDCEACHVSERVEAFEYKPLIYGGAH